MQAWRRWWQWGGLGVLGCFLAVSTGAAQWWRADGRVVETLPLGQVNWTAGLVMSRERATGTSQTGETATQAARQRLLEVLEHVQFDATQTLGSALQGRAVSRQDLTTLLADAEVSETRYFPDGTVESAVHFPFVGRLMGLLLPATTVTAGELGPDAVYTGVVIDARGLAIQPALFPRIVDDAGQVIYAPEQVDAAVAAQRGYIAYAKVFDQEPMRARIGDNPLIVRARRVAGASRVDLELRQADAAQLRAYAATQLLLKRCQVLIIM